MRITEAAENTLGDATPDWLVPWMNDVFVHVDWAVVSKGLIQLTILVGIIYIIYNRFIRESQAEQMLKGVFITLLSFVMFWGVAKAFNMPMLEVVFGASIQILFIALIVIFQPELRRMLMYLGQSELFSLNAISSSHEQHSPEYMITQVTDAVNYLSKTRYGALIVLESSQNNGGDYKEAGTPLDSQLSTELLLTIFHPNTPLHDGAVVVDQDNRISAAGVLLPLTEDPELSWQYGTRHRAAIGLTEISDSRCIVVSEETGNISLANGGKLEKLENADKLKQELENLYHVKVTSLGKRAALKQQLSGFFSNDLISSRFQKIFNKEEKSSGSGKPKSGTNG